MSDDDGRRLFEHHLRLHREAFAALDRLAPQVQQAAGLMVRTLRGNGKLLLCGNGGSAADSQHLAAEFTGRFVDDRRPLAAIALTTDSSQLTCIANDYGFDHVFERPLRAFGQTGDLLLAISTSGRSPNLLRAARAAREIGMPVIGLLGRDGGALAPLCDVAVIVAADSTARIQEAHIFIGHAWCAMVEAALGA